MALQKARSSTCGFFGTEEDCQDFELASLKGRQVPQSSPDQDDGDWQHTLALPLLCSPGQDECAAMWQVRHLMASVLIGTTYVHGAKNKKAEQGHYTAWTTEDTTWKAPRKPSKSPRSGRIQRAPTPRGHHGKGHGKGKQGPLVPEIDPPWNASSTRPCHRLLQMRPPANQIPKLLHNFRCWSPLCKSAISLCLHRRFARSSRRRPPPRFPPRVCIRL